MVRSDQIPGVGHHWIVKTKRSQFVLNCLWVETAVICRCNETMELLNCENDLSETMGRCWTNTYLSICSIGSAVSPTGMPRCFRIFTARGIC